MTQTAPFATAPPRVSSDDARRLAREIFGIDASEIAELPSERDRNFLLQTANDRFVLKFAGATESDDVLDLQDRALA